MENSNPTINVEELAPSGYLDIRNLSDYEFEFIRELAGQIAGYEPSEMWGRLTRDKPIENPFYYEKIMDADSQQALYSTSLHRGGSFSSVLKHVLHTGSKIVKGASSAANYLSRNPYLYKNIPLLNQVDPKLLKVTGDVLNKVGDYAQKGADALPSKRRKLNDGTKINAPSGEIIKENPIELHHKKVEFRPFNKINNEITNTPTPRIIN